MIPWRDNNTLHFYETNEKCWVNSVDKLCSSLFESSAKSWPELRMHYSFCKDVVIEHLLKIFYFRNFDVYQRGWLDTCSKYFRSVPLLKSTHKPPTKDQLYDALWKDEEDVFDQFHTSVVKDLNLYEDLPDIAHPDVESAHDFCQEYMMWVSLKLSKGEPLDTVSTYTAIEDLLGKHPLR